MIPSTLYHGGESLFKTTDGGMHWEAISPDLTRNDKSQAAAFGRRDHHRRHRHRVLRHDLCAGRIAADKGLIWAGTDDGLVQFTRDGGKNWTNVTPKDLPEWSRVSLIEASPFDAGTAYVRSIATRMTICARIFSRPRTMARRGRRSRKEFRTAPSCGGAGRPQEARAACMRARRRGCLFRLMMARTGVSLQLNLPNVPFTI